MILKVSYIMMIISCLALPFNSSILKVGALLLFMAFMSTVTISYLLGSWFGFILFLIYITGLLVLFGYMLAVSPNSFQKNTHSSMTPTIKLTASLSLTAMLVMIVMTLFNKTFMLPTSAKSSFSLDVVKIFSNYNLSVYWLMGILLFVALIMAVLLSYKSPKPLRPFIK